MKRIFSFALVILLAILCSSCNVSFGNYVIYADAEKYSIGDISVSTEQIKKIEINWISGKINIHRSEDGNLTAFEKEQDLESEKKMHYYLNGGILIIQYCESGYNRHWLSSSEKELDLYLPEGIDVDIDNISSNITFASDIMLEDVDISNISGNIYIKKLTADSFEFENVSGELFADEIRADRVDGETVSGDIEIDALYAYEFNAETVSGDAELGVYDKTDINIDSVSGSISLIISKNIGLSVDFSSISGDLKTSLSYVEENDTYNFGANGARAEIETVSGNLYVK